MDIVSLAEMLVSSLVQSGAGQLGKAAVDKILAILSPKMEARDVKAFEKCAQAPDDVSLLEQKNLSVALMNIFDREPSLADAVVNILERTGQKNVFQTIRQNGNGNRAVQIVGSNNHCR